MLGFLDEADDFFLDLLGQVQMVHSCVDGINFLLEDDGLLVDVVYQHGELTEQVCLGNGPHDVCDGNEYQLLVISRTQIITEEEQARSVEANAILVRVGFVKECSSVVPAPDVVKWWDPLLLPVNEIEPNARNEMHVHQQEENEFDQFNRLNKNND